MKNLLLIASFILCLGFSSQASESDLFNYDKSAVEAELTEVSELEAYLIENPADLNQMKLDQTLNKKFMLDNFHVLNPNSPQFGIEDMDWGSFAWGFCCWPIGIFTVIINKNKDTNSKISYLIGVGTSFVLGSLSWFVRGGLYAI